MSQATLKIITEQKDKNHMYRYAHSVNSTAQEVMYAPQTHNGIEIFVLLKGKIEFRIEQSTYRISPNDILLINENELHTFQALQKSTYERIVIHVAPAFFEFYGLTDCHNAIQSRAPGVHNLIPSYAAENAGLTDILRRMERYINEKPASDMVIDAVLVELLYVLSRAQLSDYRLAKSNETITNILRYINDRLTETLTLDDIAAAFFISKCHLCRIFKENTGFTIKDYIANKRILLVQSLCRDGMDIGEAAYRAGFGNYSNFYRVYVSKTGSSPREALKKFYPNDIHPKE